MENNELVINVRCFNLKYTLECGQCFRWERITDNIYIGVIKDRVLKVKQKGNNLYVSSDKKADLEEVVKKYFDLEKDYESIEKKISTFDDNVKKAVKNTSGIRILNQDFFETLISYIISTNNNIPRISKSINLISKRYGKKVVFENKEYYLFPTKNELANVKKEEYRECGVGYRDTYLADTIKDVLNGKLDNVDINTMSTKDLNKILLSFKGVGQKVADCILLFSCGKEEVFPIDVWVERIMSRLYFKEYKGKMSKKDILDYAKSHFGNYAGIVQQHLFYNIREGLI